MKISVLIVACNEAIDNIALLQLALRALQVGQVVICDNSECDYGNAKRAETLNVTYVAMNGNQGLPKAYNAGVAHCTGDVVCIFDDDTAVDASYFEAVEKAYCSADDWSIALPIVKAGDEILSPCHFDGYRARPIDPSHIGRLSDLSGINSGMAVKRELYAHMQYDQDLFLDLVDHRFILDARATGAKVIILSDTVLHQQYSLQTDSKDAALNRFRIFSRDAVCFYSTSLRHRIYCRTMLALRALKLSAKYHDARFLRMLTYK